MKKILLVEDDSSLREIYGVRLTAEGYNVISAGDGEEALATTVREKPDLILSDVMMPKISGFDMLDILRATPETRDIKIIIMTALSAEDQRERGERLGADKFLVKSQVGIEDVVNAVKEVLGEKTEVQPQGAAIPEMSVPSETPAMAASSEAPATLSSPAMAAAVPETPEVVETPTTLEGSEAGAKIAAMEAIETPIVETTTEVEKTPVVEAATQEVTEAPKTEVATPEVTEAPKTETDAQEVSEAPVTEAATPEIQELTPDQPVVYEKRERVMVTTDGESKKMGLTVNGDEVDSAEADETVAPEATDEEAETGEDKGINVFAYADESTDMDVPEVKRLAETPEEEARLRAMLDNAIAEFSDEPKSGFISSGKAKMATDVVENKTQVDSGTTEVATNEGQNEQRTDTTE